MDLRAALDAGANLDDILLPARRQGGGLCPLRAAARVVRDENGSVQGIAWSLRPEASRAQEPDHDRAVLDLPGVQEQLVRAVYATGKPIVLLLVNGRPVTLNWMAESIPAIVECWFPSEEGANAMADIVFGDVNPGGKLPVSFPRAVGQLPVYYGHRPSGGRSHWKGDYVETSVKPLYPFGHGLSYTRFAYRDLHVTPQQVMPDGVVTVSL
ncbi:MAG: glycoside hydrolase family 3 C-terminal domain-containing protein, partial [Anaerolineae bacterium]|nr:glycoside hydrolase family 3 C-terminal domain-containing protein [Anaerolineae bacterium]